MPERVLGELSRADVRGLGEMLHTLTLGRVNSYMEKMEIPLSHLAIALRSARIAELEDEVERNSAVQWAGDELPEDYPRF